MVIQVGTTVITNHDTYWKLKQSIPQYEDLIARNLGESSEILDTPFAKSCNSNVKQSTKEYLAEIKEAVRIFEETFPLVNQLNLCLQ